jgi:hypothetical protein
MAVRKRLYHPDEVRAKIKTSQLINRLNDHALADKEIMTKGQVAAALGLLKKSVPDMASVELKGDANAPLALHLTGSDVLG